MSGKIAGRVLVIIVILFAFFFLAPERYSSEVVDFLTHLATKYGVGNAVIVAEKGYQARLIEYTSWIASVPYRLALGLVSPFPWTNIFNSRNSFECFWFLTDYLHTALMFVCFGAITVFGWRDFRKGRYPPVSVVFALGVAFSGFFSLAVHNVYVQIGMLSTFPYVIDRLGMKWLLTYYLYSILLFMVASVIWIWIR